MYYNSSTNKHEPKGFLESALAIHGSVTPRVLKQVLWVMLYAAVISSIEMVYPDLQLPIGPFEYAGLVMGLLLVFRINAGYERWWEARKIWGSVVNQSRNLAIQIANYVEVAPSDSSELKRVLNLVAATPYLIKMHLRVDKNYKRLEHLFNKDDFALLKNSGHPVVTVSSLIAEILHTYKSHGQLNEFAFMKAEEQRGILIDCMGACERIIKTPMPLVMGIKTRRFIMLFLLVLPFGLLNHSVVLTSIFSGLVAYSFFSLDQIGIELQNPFLLENLSHHPLTSICQTIEANINELLP